MCFQFKHHYRLNISSIERVHTMVWRGICGHHLVLLWLSHFISTSRTWIGNLCDVQLLTIWDSSWSMFTSPKQNCGVGSAHNLLLLPPTWLAHWTMPCITSLQGHCLSLESCLDFEYIVHSCVFMLSNFSYKPYPKRFDGAKWLMKHCFHVCVALANIQWNITNYKLKMDPPPI